MAQVLMSSGHEWLRATWMEPVDNRCERQKTEAYLPVRYTIPQDITFCGVIFLDVPRSIRLGIPWCARCMKGRLQSYNHIIYTWVR